MVTQAQLNDGLEKLRMDLTAIINESIQSVKDTVISNLTKANKDLFDKVKLLEEKVVGLETELHANNHYNRQCNILISGIPEEVPHESLEKISVNIINKCCSAIAISPEEVQGCHWISQKMKMLFVD